MRQSEGKGQRIPRFKGHNKESLVLLMGKDKESLFIEFYYQC